jgi:MFS family permease
MGFALTSDVGPAIAARMLIGIGDAMTFISVLRLVTMWFPPRRNALMVQLTAVVGGLGAVVSASPLLLLLHRTGWTASFLAAAGLGLAAAALVFTTVRDAPGGAGPQAPGAPPAGGRVGLRAVWAEPGTRLGLWTHFVTQFSGLVFILLWGYPFLVQGEALAPTTAALLLTVLTAGSVATGPLVGHFCGRLPYRRSTLVLAITATTAAVWTVVLLWPGPAPLWLLTVLICVLALNGPGSAVGFDFARSFNPAHHIGRANGVVNVGGFAASILLTIAIGLALDVQTPVGSTYRPDAFRWAFALQYVLWAVGTIQVLRYRNATRRRLAAQDPVAFAALRRRPAAVATD